MADIYLYYAFRDSREDAIIFDCPKHFDQAGLKTKVIEHAGTPKPLAVVSHEDLLIITSHGSNSDPGNVSLSTPSGGRKMSASDLANQIFDDGLDRKHQSILLTTCESGGKTTLKSGELPDGTGRAKTDQITIARNKMGECFASILAKAMGMKTYTDILVGGFPGVFSPISYSLNNKPVFRAQDGTRILAEIDHIQWFDAQGKNTTS
jgi:hypothetical protein